MDKSNTFPGKDEILNAADRISKFIHHTPVLSSENLNTITSTHIYFKCENFQKAGAFKTRGACNAIFSLDPVQLSRGVCTHSSGNHAAALARAGKLRNTPVYIVMPENSSRVKVDAVIQYGGRITFCKPTLQSREDTLSGLINETGAYEIHPYNDKRIITGQATAALEFFSLIDKLDCVIVPVGGGGLLSGTALAAHYFSSGAKVFAAEPAGADDAFRSMQAGKILPSIDPVTIADGLKTSLGSLTFPVIMKYVDSILTVSEESIIRAMKLIWERMKIVIEPSAATPFAAVLEYPGLFRNKHLGIILSGGNVDLDSIPWIGNHK
ncbi:MAG: pyridoxal-phosphate dependent enzyme [Bacteroidales bacterium]